MKAETYIPPYDYTLKEGINIDNTELMVGDKVLLVDQLDSKKIIFHGIFEITLNGYRKIEYFTYLNIPLQSGLTITVTEGEKNNNKIFIVKQDLDNTFIVDSFRDEKSAKYKSYEIIKKYLKKLLFIVFLFITILFSSIVTNYLL